MEEWEGEVVSRYYARVTQEEAGPRVHKYFSKLNLSKME
jgi:hypothetical protein